MYIAEQINNKLKIIEEYWLKPLIEHAVNIGAVGLKTKSGVNTETSLSQLSSFTISISEWIWLVKDCPVDMKDMFHSKDKPTSIKKSGAPVGSPAVVGAV